MGFCILVLISYEVILLGVNIHKDMDSLEREETHAMAYLESFLESTLWNLDVKTTNLLLESVVASPNIKSVMVYTEDSRTVFASAVSKDFQESQDPPFLYNLFLVDYLKTKSQEIRRGEKILGTFLVTFYFSALNEEWQYLLWRIMIGVISFALVLSFTLIQLVKRTFQTPLNLILRRLDSLNKGEFPELPLSERRDEMGKLARGINQITTELRRLNSRQESTNERLQLASSLGNLGIWDWDHDSKELKWDLSMYSLYGMTPGDTDVVYDLWKSALYPDDRENAIKDFQATIKYEQEYHSEFRIQRAGDGVRWIKARGVTFFDEKGKALRTMGINSDITDLRTQAKKDLIT